MKRLLFAFAIATASLATLGSCTKEYITNTYLPSQTFIYEREAKEWKGSGKSKYIDLTINELTDHYLLQGIVQVHISTDDENSYHAIPAVISGISYSYTYSPKTLRIYIEDPIYEDGAVVTPPANTVFKITLTDAEFVN